MTSSNASHDVILKDAGMVSEQALEYLLTELSNYAAKSCIPAAAAAAAAAAESGTAGVAIATTTTITTTASNAVNTATTLNTNAGSSTATTAAAATTPNTTAGEGVAATTATTAIASSSASASANPSLPLTPNTTNSEERWTIAAEMAAAKLERIGWSVGYRWTERLSQNKSWNAVAPAGGDEAAAVAAQQLEAVKFLCKEVWMEIFRKQIDKLQTNHRGVFVLKDLDLRWMSRFPVGPEDARVSAIRLLAFPCGLIRGALANLGIPAVVSCDFLADGQHMSACSFNIKVK